MAQTDIQTSRPTWQLYDKKKKCKKEQGKLGKQETNKKQRRK